MAQPLKLYYDFETRGDLDIRKVGSSRYIKEATPTWVAWAVNDGEVQVRKWSTDTATTFGAALRTADEVVAHNSVFDLLVLKFHDHDLFKAAMERRLSCTYCMAGYLNLPRSLGNLAELFGLEKKKEVNHDNDLFGSTEDEWRDYVRHDVVLLREVDGLFRKRMPDREHDLIDLHLRMQVRGVNIDTDRLKELIAEEGGKLKELDAEFIDLTGGYGPTQTVRLKDWFQKHAGYGSASTKELRRHGRDTNGEGWTKEGIAALKLLLKRADNEFVKLRKVKEEMVGGRLFDTLYHAKTSTNRWAGHGAHLHNMRKKGRARSIIIPGKGKGLVVSDLSQIEMRVGLWVAGMGDALNDLVEHDWYMDITKGIYGSDHSPERLQELRDRVKQGVLGTMYASGVQRVAEGIKGTMDEAAQLLEETKKRIMPAVRKSEELLKAWVDVAENNRLGYFRKVSVGLNGSHRVMIGRPKVGERPFHNTVVMRCPRGQIVYRDVERNGKEWKYIVGREPKYMRHRGSIYSNVCSTIAREVFATGLLRIASSPNLTPISTIHDEVLVEVEECLMDKKPEKHVWSAITQPVEGLEGLPLDSKGEVRNAWKEQKQ